MRGHRQSCVALCGNTVKVVGGLGANKEEPEMGTLTRINV
eukprot:gene9412-10416_t